MELSVGHTPDADDAFMFYGMFTGKVTSPDFTVTHVIEDIENLNRKATSPELDVTAFQFMLVRIYQDIQFYEAVEVLESVMVQLLLQQKKCQLRNCKMQKLQFQEK